MRLKPLHILTLALFTAAPAMAKEPAFVPPSMFDARTVLHAPPANESAQTKAELAELHRIQAVRTKAQFEKAKTDGEDETVFLFHTVFGDSFTAEKLPVTAAFFKKVGNDEGIHATIAKNEWKRPRPFRVDSTIKPCGPGKSPAYPSGHATRGYLLGVVLGATVPEKRDAILDRSADYAHSRLLCGVHYRSDVEAGKLVGTALASVMLTLPQVRQEMEAVRAELQAAGLAAK